MGTFPERAYDKAIRFDNNFKPRPIFTFKTKAPIIIRLRVAPIIIIETSPSNIIKPSADNLVKLSIALNRAHLKSNESITLLKNKEFISKC